MAHFDRIRLARNISGALKAFEGVEQQLDTSGLPDNLRHLIKLRASQMNSCAYCVGLHTSEARKDGETNQRLDHVAVWRDADYYGDAERTAFAWTEALTEPGQVDDLDTLHSALKQHFNESEIAALTTQIVMINVWNRLQISSHGRRAELSDKKSRAI